jgi:hypothetical protein
MVSVDLSQKLALSGASSGEAINLANAFSTSVERFTKELNVYDMKISMALDKGEGTKAKELFAERAIFISDTKTSLAKQQESVSSNLKEGLENYIKNFHERDVDLAKVEIAATLIPGGLALKELKTGGKALWALGKAAAVKAAKQGAKHSAKHAAEHLAEHAAKAGGIGLMKHEMRQDAANVSSEILTQATNVNMTALDYAKELVPVYGSVKQIEHLKHAQHEAGERAEKTIASLFGEAAGPTRVAMKGGHE